MTISDANTLYRKLVEHMNEGVWMGDDEERTIYANPKFCEMMGYSLKEMLGRKSYDFWDPESAKEVERVNRTKRKKGVSSSYEGNLLTKKGKLIPVLLSGTPLPWGGTVGIMTDLTELKRKEEAERVLIRAVTQASDGILIVSDDGTIVNWNKGARIIFGFREENIKGKPLTKIFSENDVEDFLAHTPATFSKETTGIHKNGKRSTVSVHVSPIPHPESKKRQILLIVRDISSQRKFEDELSLKYQKMRDAYNQMGIMRRQMDYMVELAQVCASSSDKKALCDFIVNSVIMLTRVDACVLRTRNKKTDELELVSSFGVSDDWRGKKSMTFKGSLVEKAWKQGVPLKIIDLLSEPLYTSSQLARQHGFTSTLVIPLIFRSVCTGSITLYVTQEKKLELFENEFIEDYAKLAGVMLTASV